MSSLVKKRKQFTQKCLTFSRKILFVSVANLERPFKGPRLLKNSLKKHIISFQKLSLRVKYLLLNPIQIVPKVQ